jgi:hypothetical protein
MKYNPIWLIINKDYIDDPEDGEICYVSVTFDYGYFPTEESALTFIKTLAKSDKIGYGVRPLSCGVCE